MFSHNQNIFLLLALVTIVVLTSAYLYSRYSQYKNKEEMRELKSKVQRKDFTENEEDV